MGWPGVRVHWMRSRGWQVVGHSVVLVNLLDLPGWEVLHSVAVHGVHQGHTGWDVAGGWGACPQAASSGLLKLGWVGVALGWAAIGTGETLEVLGVEPAH
jgi:hypothetical protein